MSHKLPDIDESKIVYDTKDKKCAPSKKFENLSCYSLQFLIKMAEKYNESAIDKIDMYNNMEVLNPVKYKKYLLYEFSIKLKDKCNNQRCWIKQMFIKNLTNDSEIENTFRPEGPKGKFEWLNTYNILDTLKQYEKVHKDFEFLGAVPIDFDDLEDLGIKNLNLQKKYDSGIRKLGIVFNLDEHYKSGSHWVAAFCDFNVPGVYYYDSYSGLPEKRIQKLLRRFTVFIENNDKIPKNKSIRGGVDVRYNKNRNQYKNSECGVYSINFIEQMLTKSFDDVVEKIIDDDTINKKREVYFT